MPALTSRIGQQRVFLEREIARSGEGTIWETDQRGLLAKLYHSPDLERVQKLEVMVAYPPRDPNLTQGHPTLAWPQDLLENQQGECVGFLMPLIPRSVKLSSIYNPRLRSRKAPQFNWYYLHVTALNLASILQSLHRSGYVVGDLKPQNLMVNPQALVAVIDTDSFQIREPHTGKVFRCLVGSEGFTPVELLGKTLADLDQTEAQDCFRLGVIIHLLLFGDHPFKGRWIGAGESPNPTELIRRGFWPFGPNSLIQPGPNTIPLEIVHPAIQACFDQCFTAGHQQPEARPTAQTWYQALRSAIAELQLCPQEPNHYYSLSYNHCYWCDRSNTLGIDIFSPTGFTTGKTRPPSSSPLPQGQRSHRYPPVQRQRRFRAQTHSTWKVKPGGSRRRWLPLPSAQVGGLFCLLSGIGMLLLIWPEVAVRLAAGEQNLLPQTFAIQKLVAPKITLEPDTAVDSNPRGHADRVTAVVISPNGKLLASGSWDRTIKLWNLQTGELLRTLSGHSDRVADLAIAPDNQILISSSTDGEIVQWHLATGTVIRSWASHLQRELSPLNPAVAFTPDGQRLARNSWGGTIVLQDLQTGSIQRTLSGYLFSQQTMTISQDGTLLASGSADARITLWNLQTGKLIRNFPEGWEGGTADLPRSLSFTPDGQTLISGNWGGSINLWQVKTGRWLRSLQGHTHPILALATATQGHLLASGGSDRQIYLWQLQTGELLQRLSGHEGSILALSISPDGKILASGSEDGTIKLWHLPNGLLQRTLPAPD